MKLAKAFRNFLFPFDQETMVVPELKQKTLKYRYIKRSAEVEPAEDVHRFDASDCFLYLNHL